jgi:RHS repeat-associated protein
MKTNIKYILILLLSFFSRVNAQCDGSYGSIVISEVYFDTQYSEDLGGKYHSFGEYIELFNSSDTAIDLNGWKIMDNHTEFQFTNSIYNQDLIIAPGGYKIVTNNGFYGYGAPSHTNSGLQYLGGAQSAIGGKQKFIELFPEAVGRESDIILQNTMVLFNKTDKISLYNMYGKLISEVSYLNAPTTFVGSKPGTPLEYMNIQGYTVIINPVIDNLGIKFLTPFNYPIGYRPLLDALGNIVFDNSGPVPIPFLVQNLNLKKSIYLTTNNNGFYSNHSALDYQVAVGTPFSIPTSVPLKPVDPLMIMPIGVTTSSNYTENFSYNLQTGAVNGQSKIYFDDLGKPNVSLSKDFVSQKIWGTEKTYDSFGRKSKESFPAISCFNFEKVNFLSSPATKTALLDTYYGNFNTLEPYQATAQQTYTEINYDKLNPGNVINALGGNKVEVSPGVFEWKSGYSYTVPAAQEMYYLFGYNYFNGGIISGTPSKEELIPKYYKTVSVDANGVENVSFSDGEGKLLASARSGTTTPATITPYPVYSLIGTQGFVDIHIPVGITTPATIFGFASTTDYKIFDLKTGLLTTSPLTGGNGYRIVANTPPTTDPKMYVTNATPGVLSYDPGAKGVSYNVNYYDYAINVYDKVGRLTKTIQPNGFRAIYPSSPATFTLIAAPAYLASPNFATSYTYNSLGQVTQVVNPDEGTSKFCYRKDGQIRYSQSAVQGLTKLSYTNYDSYGRPIESGVLTGASGFWTTAAASTDLVALVAGIASEQTFTVYDSAEIPTLPIPTPDLSLNGVLTSAGIPSASYIQKNLAGNVAVTYTIPSTTITAKTWYSYDIYGRLEWLVQYNEGIGAKTISYAYDANGNVSTVTYQNDIEPEFFTHQYFYDANNVIKQVRTGADYFAKPLQQVAYSYYLTGELKRTYLTKVAQGIDYVYTLGGMLKSINHPSLEKAKDPGADANDAFGTTIDYYSGDYLRASTNIATAPNISGSNQDYNGNIKAITWANKTLDVVNQSLPVTATNLATKKSYLYNYNRDNWLSEATFGSIANTGNPTMAITPATSYREGALTYDSNGNIKTLQRTNAAGATEDNLTYNYTYAGKNQLNFVGDVIADGSHTTDIDGQVTTNYVYDANGQLILNKKETTHYVYNTFGLVTEIRTGNLVFASATTKVKFYYNERGQRVKKESYTTGLQSTTFYILDLSGNVMSTYYKLASSPTITQTEISIYGISRIGVYMKVPSPGINYTNYEITDHLGNVRVVLQKPDNTATSTVNSYADYYPFGEQLPNRKSFGGYRYAFQGQELDQETGMEAFKLRLWDGRIGRWLSPDPYGQYASPYLGMGNNPVTGIDQDGGFWQELKNFVFGPGWISNKGLKALKAEGITEFTSRFSKTPTDPKGNHTVAYTKDGEVVFRKFKNVNDLRFEDSIGFKVSVGIQAGFNLSKSYELNVKLFSVDVMEWSAYSGWNNYGDSNVSSMDFLSVSGALDGANVEIGFNMKGPKNQGLAFQDFSGHGQVGYTSLLQAGVDFGSDDPAKNGFYTQHGVSAGGGAIIQVEFFCKSKLYHGLPTEKKK